MSVSKKTPRAAARSTRARRDEPVAGRRGAAAVPGHRGVLRRLPEPGRARHLRQPRGRRRRVPRRRQRRPKSGSCARSGRPSAPPCRAAPRPIAWPAFNTPSRPAGPLRASARWPPSSRACAQAAFSPGSDATHADRWSNRTRPDGQAHGLEPAEGRLRRHGVQPQPAGDGRARRRRRDGGRLAGGGRPGQRRGRHDGAGLAGRRSGAARPGRRLHRGEAGDAADRHEHDRAGRGAHGSTRPSRRRASGCSTRRSAAATSAPRPARCRSWSAARPRTSSAPGRCSRRWARRITLCGPAGAGQLVKACNQIVGALVLNAISEAIVFGRAAGVDPEIMIRVLQGGVAATRAMEVRGARMAKGDFAPGFKAAHHLKDLRIVIDEAKAMGLTLPTTVERRRDARHARPRRQRHPRQLVHPHDGRARGRRGASRSPVTARVAALLLCRDRRRRRPARNRPTTARPDACCPADRPARGRRRQGRCCRPAATSR